MATNSTTTEYSIAKVQRAAKHLGATELPSGDWAYYDDGMTRWYVVDPEDLASLCDYLDDEDEQISKDAYSHWCAGTTSVEEMPKGWSPDTASDWGEELYLSHPS